MSNPFYNGIEFRWEEHKRLWNWLSENPEKSKSDWPEWNTFKEAPSNCFACKFDEAMKKNIFLENDCVFCPLTKKGNSLYCICLDGLFYRWYYAHKKQKYIISKQIANLPLRDDWDWKTSTGEPYGSR